MYKKRIVSIVFSMAMYTLSIQLLIEIPVLGWGWIGVEDEK